MHTFLSELSEEIQQLGNENFELTNGRLNYYSHFGRISSIINFINVNENSIDLKSIRIYSTHSVIIDRNFSLKILL